MAATTQPSRLHLPSPRGDSQAPSDVAAVPSPHAETSRFAFSGARSSRTTPKQVEKGIEDKYDDPEIEEILRRGAQRDVDGKDKRRRLRFNDLAFTQQFTVFDRQNPTRSTSSFHGFFTMFWLGTFLMLVRVGASNWKIHGNIFGPNEILALMIRRDLAVLGLTDGVMCASTAFSLILQKVIVAGHLSWEKSGWIIQNVWQTLFMGATLGWAVYRGWPWSHTFFIFVHCLVMLMKQHSYAFYNGHCKSETRFVPGGRPHCGTV